MAVTVICVGITGAVPKQLNINVSPDVKVSLGGFLRNYLPLAGGPNLASIILDNSVQEGYVVLLDGRNIVQLDGLATPVEDGSTIIVTTQVVGG